MANDLIRRQDAQFHACQNNLAVYVKPLPLLGLCEHRQGVLSGSKTRQRVHLETK